MPENSAETKTRTAAKLPAHQSVYVRLRNRILFGDLAPGQAVTIQGIAEELDAGMTPVREAIRRLTSGGALNMMDNRRVTVPILTEKCIEELDFVRKAIEPELTGRAVGFVTKASLRSLKEIDSALNDAIERGDIKTYLTQNYKFHATVYGMADAPIMAATVDRLWLRFGPSLRVVCGRYGTMNLPDKHADLLDAFANGDRAAAEKAMAADVAQGMIQIRDALRDSAPNN
jgi:DNA-binding GntR family transcriptional regulator